jgi:hypothetical protein
VSTYLFLTKIRFGKFSFSVIVTVFDPSGKQLFLSFMSSPSSAEFRKNEMFLNVGSNYLKLKSS